MTPGLVFTPTVSIGVTYDDNPVLAGSGADRRTTSSPKCARVPI